MSLIKCPQCGREISDKSNQCIHCGYEFHKNSLNNVKKCPECDTILNDSDEQCPNCGYPTRMIEKTQIEFRSHHIQARLNRFGKKRAIISACIITAVIAVLATSIWQIIRYNARKEYANTLELAQTTMHESAVNAENIMNTALNVWYNTIFEEEDPLTDDYTMLADGVFNSDFNISLYNYYNDPEIANAINDLEIDQELIKEYMKELQKPSDEFTRCYETVNDLYESYQSIINLTTNPEGSYDTYSEDKKTAVDEYLKIDKKLTTQIPER